VSQQPVAGRSGRAIGSRRAGTARAACTSDLKTVSLSGDPQRVPIAAPVEHLVHERVAGVDRQQEQCSVRRSP